MSKTESLPTYRIVKRHANSPLQYEIIAIHNGRVQQIQWGTKDKHFRWLGEVSEVFMIETGLQRSKDLHVASEQPSCSTFCLVGTVLWSPDYKRVMDSLAKMLSYSATPLERLCMLWFVIQNVVPVVFNIRCHQYDKQSRMVAISSSTVLSSSFVCFFCFVLFFQL